MGRSKPGCWDGGSSGSDAVEKAAEPPARTANIEAQADGAVKTSEAIVEQQGRSAPPPRPPEVKQSPPVRMFWTNSR